MISIKINVSKTIIVLLLLVVGLGLLTGVSARYVGDGYSHNVADNYYDSMSDQDILNKYNDSTCHAEETAVCTKVVVGDTI